MSTLIVDIETVGENWGDIDEVTKDALTRWVNQLNLSEEEKRSKLTDIENSLGFSPLTGFIVALGVYDIDRKQGTVYYQGSENDVDEQMGEFFYRPRPEKEMLAEFWEGVTLYDTVVTFNGRAFDLPFILHRSVVCGVVPTVDLMRYRYLTQQQVPYHVDLQDQLTFYGSMMKRPGLHLFCRAYGVPSPKEGGVSGDDVAGLFYSKKSRDIAKYNSRDLLATALLYEKWRAYLAPPLFRKVSEDIDLI